MDAGAGVGFTEAGGSTTLADGVVCGVTEGVVAFGVAAGFTGASVVCGLGAAVFEGDPPVGDTPPPPFPPPPFPPFCSGVPIGVTVEG